MSFHDILFPLDIAFGASGGPERRTEIVTLGSGFEERNTRLYHSRRKYDAGYGVKSLEALSHVLGFFEERRGRLYGFRFRDKLDHKSCAINANPHFSDQEIGVGDGVLKRFQLTKTYGDVFAPYQRDIRKPVVGSVVIGMNGAALSSGFDVNYETGEVLFTAAPAQSAVITAGFRFDVPVRFDSDRLDINLKSFQAGDIPHIPLIEIRV